MAAIIYRPAGEADLEQTYRLFVSATNDLLRRRNLPTVASHGSIAPRAMAFRQHALKYDNSRFWVASDRDQLVGFGIATLRGDLWYLAALHVLPTYQGHGIGQQLLARCLPPPPMTTTKIVISDSLNPVSNALYAKHGLYQAIPLLLVRGRPSPGLSSEDRLQVELIESDSPPLAELDVIDRGVLGTTRHQDHEHWLAQPDQMLWLFRLSDGEVAGYAYVSDDGIGPAAVREQRGMVPILVHCLEQLHSRGSADVHVKIPATCHAGVDHLLRQGFRYEQILLICASRPLPELDRYLVSVGDALF